MVDRITGRRLAVSLIFCLIMGSGLVLAAQAAPADSATAHQAKSAADEELNLDESDGALVPAAPKVESKPAAAAAEKPSPVPEQPKAGGAQTAATESKPAQPSAVAAPAAAAADTAKRTQDEELILDGGSDNLLDRAAIAAKKAEETKKLTTASDSANKTTAAAPQNQAARSTGDATNKIPTPPTASTATTAASGKIPTASAAAVTATADVPIDKGLVEKERSVNFAKNFKEYRSPKLAMLMSLILPGSGQVYAGSGMWAVGFAAVEAAIITGGVALANKASRVKKQAHAFADTAYSVDKMKEYDSNLTKYINTSGRYFSPDTAVNDTIYRKRLLNEEIFAPGEYDQFNADARSRSDAFYNTIYRGSSPFIRGWKDVKPAFSSDGFNLGADSARYGIDSSYYRVFARNPNDAADSSQVMYGQSSYFDTYSGMMHTSINWSNRSRNVFVTLLVNHIVSAVIAGIQAQRHNDQLLGRQSYLEHLDLQMDYVNTGTETVPGYSLAVKF